MIPAAVQPGVKMVVDAIASDVVYEHACLISRKPEELLTIRALGFLCAEE